MPHQRFIRFLYLTFALILLLGLGITYFYVTTDSNFMEAVWYTVTVVSTLGMADVKTFSLTDKMVSSILVIMSVILFSFLIANVSEVILGGQIKSYFGKRRMKDKLDKLKDHYIICGYGRIGKSIAFSLLSERLPFVVIEKDDNVLGELENQDTILYLQGDTTLDEVLREAGVERAIGLFSALRDDPENILTVLNARALNSKLIICSRVSTQELEIRFMRAGANYCVSPQSWGSRSMVLTMLHPNLSLMLQQFLDKSIEAGTFMEIVIPENSPVAGKSLEESGIRKVSQVNVIGIRKAKDFSMAVNPQASHIVERGDTLICLGDKQSFSKLKAHIG